MHRIAYRQVLNEKWIQWELKGPIFWFKTNKYKIAAALVVGAIPGAVIGAEKEILFDPGICNGLALAGIGVGLVVLLLAMKYGVDKCRTNSHEYPILHMVKDVVLAASS